MLLFCNNVSHWLGTNLESALKLYSKYYLFLSRNCIWKWQPFCSAGKCYSLRPSDAYVCVNIYQAIIGSDNGMSTSWHQAFIRISAGVLLIGTLVTNLSDIWTNLCIFFFMKRLLKMSSAKLWPFCLGLKVSMIMMIIGLPLYDNLIMIRLPNWYNPEVC